MVRAPQRPQPCPQQGPQQGPTPRLPPRRLALLLLVGSLATSTSGCIAVSRKVYDRDVAALRQQADWLEAQKRKQAADSAQWSAKYAASQEELAVCRKNASDLDDAVHACEQKLNDVARNNLKCGDLFRQCEDEKAKLRDELLAERNKRVELANRLADIQRQLDELSRSIGDVRGRLAELIKAGKLRVEVKNGFLVIGLESDILFDTGKSDLKTDARPVLLELAKVLQQFKDKRFQVAGHTDKRGGGDVNWPLSVNRALSVVQFMIKSGDVPAHMLSAGGYAHYLPSNDGEDADSLRQNRRVEFLLMPDLSELYKLASMPAPTPARTSP